MKLLLLITVSVFIASFVHGGLIRETKEIQQQPKANLSLVHFNLWTRRNPEVLQEIINGDVESLQASFYDPAKPTKVFAHGWRDNGYDEKEVVSLRDAFLRISDVNFITVDWTELAGNTDYLIPATNTIQVGAFAGEFLQFLIDQGSDINNFHIIGFSLGAHVAGNAGAYLGGRIPRITGLDPAKPAFTLNDTDTRLDITDGQFIDIIHTNSASLTGGGVAFAESIGHVDFWPNGGAAQPGCAAPGPDLVDLITACSHSRAPMYYAESIEGGSFTSTQCDSFDNYNNGLCSGNPQVLLGYFTPNTARGNYYLNTSDSAPFSLN